MIIGGVDEVGRGAFAGPLIAGCVIWDSHPRVPKGVKINDSKALTSTQRLVAAKWIRENCLSWGVGSASAGYIDKFGLTKAANKAFREAISKAKGKKGVDIERLMIDAFYIPFVKGIPKNKQFAIVGADGKSFTVAAASIIAKVYRDKLMSTLGKRPFYKRYLWDTNMGYGTKEHREAIKKYGTTKYHRKLFLRKMTLS